MAVIGMLQVYFPIPLAAVLRAVLESQSRKKADLEEAALMEVVKCAGAVQLAIETQPGP